MQAKGSSMSAYLSSKTSQPQVAADAARPKAAASKTKHHGAKPSASHSHPQHSARSLVVDEPNMSDTGLLVTVEDLINTCFGQSDANVVNCKALQTILRFMAQQVRIMDHQVQMMEETRLSVMSDDSSEGSDASRTKKKGPKKRHTAKSSKDKSDTKVPHIKSEPSFRREKSEAKFVREKSVAKFGREKSAATFAGRDDSEKAKAVSVKSKEEKGAKGKEEEKEEKAKGPAAGEHTAKVGSIEVVTVSQFELLEKAVNALKAKAAPLPMPTLPDNKKLKQGILEGKISLTDTMQAMQMGSRIHATEATIGRLIELLTHMARIGVLPRDLALQAQDIAHDADDLVHEAKSAVKAGKSITQHDAMLGASWRPETWKRPQSKTTGPAGPAGVAGRDASTDSDMLTVEEMQEILSKFREEVFKTMNEITAHATRAADAAVTMANTAHEKMDIASSLDNRLSTLYNQVSEYTKHRTGLDTGLASQITSFQDQLNQVRREMSGAVVQMSKIKNNAETAAVIELTERYTNLVNSLEDTLHEHQYLEHHQGQLNDDSLSLAQWVEMLREQKADRDEVKDGLKDKADISRLAGMLMQDDFDFQRTGFELRVQMVYEKFRKQDNVWMAAVKDFTEQTALKANTDQLLKIRAALEAELQEIHGKVKVLQRILGQPKAAMATRTLRINASCGACSEPAVLDPSDPMLPLRLPAIRRGAPGSLARDYSLCLGRFSAMDEPPEGKKHTCRRWVGGSHTLITPGMTKERAQTVIPPLSRKTYLGLGTDKKFYKLEKLVLPCEECNQQHEEDPGFEQIDETARFEIGAGDQDDVPPDAIIQDIPTPDSVQNVGAASAQAAASASRSASVIINLIE